VICIIADCAAGPNKTPGACFSSAGLAEQFEAGSQIASRTMSVITLDPLFHSFAALLVILINVIIYRKQENKGCFLSNDISLEKKIQKP
jgi:hypothetical protein